MKQISFLLLLVGLFMFNQNNAFAIGGGTHVDPPAGMPPCGSQGSPGDALCNATPICDLNGYCGTTSSSWAVDTWSNLTSAFCGSIENNAFLSFTATSSTISFNCYVYNADDNEAIQVFIFSAADCDSGPVTALTCVDEMYAQSTPYSISASGLIPGNQYYIMIDGFAGDVCDYTFEATSGVALPVTADGQNVSIDSNNNFTICQGESVIVNASGGMNTYTWSGDPGLSATTGSTVTITPPTTAGVYNYSIQSSGTVNLCPQTETFDFTITVTDCNTCAITSVTAVPGPCDPPTNQFSVTGQIVFHDPPTTGTLIIQDCNGHSTTLSAPFSSPINYTISGIPSDGTTCNVTAHFSDDATCTAISADYQAPADCSCIPPNIVPVDVPLCVGGTADLNDGIDPTSDPNTATFYATSADAYAGTNPISNIVSSAGTYWVSGAMPGHPNCITVKKINVVQVTITYTSNVIDATCLDPNGEITLTGSGGVSPYSYTVDDGSSYNQTNTTGHFTGLHQGGYSITITDNQGCETTDVIAVDNSGAPYFDGVYLTSPSCNEFCDGEIEVNVTGGNIPYSYVIVNANGDTLSNTSGGAQSTISNLCSGNYLIDVTDATGCKAVMDTILPETPAVDSSFQFNDFCFETTNGPINVATAGGTFSFDPMPSDGATINPATGEISNETIGATYSVKYNTGGACPETETHTVTVKGLVINAAGTDANCAQSDGSINVSITGGAIPYNYTFDNGTTSQSGTTSQTTQLIDHIPSGTYHIVVQGNNGCNADTSLVLNDIPGPTVLAANDTTICLGESVVLSSSNPNNVHIGWSNGHHEGETVSPTSPGSYEYYVIASDTATTCHDNDTLTVVVKPLPVPLFKADSSLSGCAPLSLVFIDTTGVPLNSCFWDFGDGETSNVMDTVPHTYQSPGVYTVSLTIEDTMGCVGTSTKTDYITVFDHPVADFTASPMVTDYNNTQVNFTDNSHGAVVYSWNYGDNSALDSLMNPTHEFPSGEVGNYTVSLTIYDANGCSNQVQKVIQIINPDMKYKLPNIFTPNGDGVNDYFKFVYQEGIAEINLVVLNRWGDVVFESDKINFKWNGSKRNSDTDCVDGTYFYKILIKNMLGKEVKEYGYVHLVRGK